jgi:hypothetical protein
MLLALRRFRFEANERRCRIQCMWSLRDRIQERGKDTCQPARVDDNIETLTCGDFERVYLPGTVHQRSWRLHRLAGIMTTSIDTASPYYYIAVNINTSKACPHKNDPQAVQPSIVQDAAPPPDEHPLCRSGYRSPCVSGFGLVQGVVLQCGRTAW